MKLFKNRQVAQNVQPQKGGKKDAPTYDTRVCVPAPMPVACPNCHSIKNTAANGVHYNQHFGVRYEHRVCKMCGYTFTASRRMTKEELDEAQAR